MSDLLPCPFCGGEDIRGDVLEGFSTKKYVKLRCFNCGACGGRCFTHSLGGTIEKAKRKAEKQWNTRHSPITPEATREDLVKLTPEISITKDGKRLMVKDNKNQTLFSSGEYILSTEWDLNSAKKLYNSSEETDE